jgi:hypothetical protein
MEPDVWTVRSGVSPLSDEVVGFEVVGRDGRIAKVDHVSYGGTCVVVSTGRLLGKKYVVPAWAVERTDHEARTVSVDLTKDDVERSPEYDDHLGFDDECEARVGAYYEDLVSSR